MTPEQRIEAVARAALEELERQRVSIMLEPDLDQVILDGECDLLKVVRVVVATHLQSLREPSEGMHAAGREAMSIWGTIDGCDDTVDAIHEAMIDTAIAELGNPPADSTAPQPPAATP